MSSAAGALRVPLRNQHDDERRELLDSVLHGLAASPKTLECKFLYDQAGAELFDRICELPEYYPTRTETRILEAHASDIAALAGVGAELVELGSGFGHKTRLLLSSMASPAQFTPVDIAPAPMQASALVLREQFPRLRVDPVVADFNHSFELPARLAGGRRVLFFAGSTIGNFSAEQAHSLLHRWREELAPDVFIIGVDLDKDEQTLVNAYDDAAGVTAAFNKNLLRRINRELGADFDLGAFRHEARYNRQQRRIEMHLVSERAQVVRLASRRFEFQAGESIHTESSHKYTIAAFQQLARGAGWNYTAAWVDADALFSVHVLTT